MVGELQQGTIIRIENIKFPMLIVSKNTFNDAAEQVIACPIVPESAENALHKRMEAGPVNGFLLCEQLRLFDLKFRGFSKLAELSVEENMEISDTIQSIFDYI